MAAWPVSLFWALDIVATFSVSSLIDGLGFADSLGERFFAAVWRTCCRFSCFFHLFAFCLADFSRLGISMHVLWCTWSVITSGKHKRQGPLVL
jgi:hypothetical protein